MKTYILLLLFLAMGLLTMAPQGLEAATVEVQMTSGLRFVPADVTINAGDTIRWSNAGGGTHTTTSGTNCTPDGLWNANVNSVQTFERVFTDAGDFPYFCAVAFHCQSGMVGTITVNAAATMALPQSHLVFTPAPSSDPVLNADPALANPIGLGSIAACGDTLDIGIGTVGFSGPVEVYFAVFSPQALGTNDILLFTGTTFVAFSQAGIVPWIASTTGPLDQNLFGAIPLSALPSGDYSLFFAVAPAGSSLATFFYLWPAVFTVP
jgi:plastocyanin